MFIKDGMTRGCAILAFYSRRIFPKL